MNNNCKLCNLKNIYKSKKKKIKNNYYQKLKKFKINFK